MTVARAGGTVAREANQLEAALRAAGLDPDNADHIWDLWQEQGYSAACAALNRKGTDMEIVFNPDAPWTEATKHDAHGPYAVQRQTIWQQLESDVWLEVRIERTGQLRAGQLAAPYIADAIRRAGHQPDNSWREVQPVDRTRLRLVPQATAPRTSPPAPPAPPSHSGQRYIDRVYGQSKAAE